MTGGHPSRYALDRLRLGLTTAGVREHAAGCVRCSAHLAEEAPQLPAWLADVPRRRRRPWRFTLPVLGMGLAAALILVVVRPPRPEDLPAIRTKAGAPAVLVHVKRNERVFGWDGRTPVRAGDRLRLSIMAVERGHVSVAALTPAGGANVLYAGPLSSGRVDLPVSFRVDDRGHEEVISIIVSPLVIPPNRHHQADDSRHEEITWRQILVFPKEAP